MVPLLVISTKVIIAIKISGIGSLPKKDKANTSVARGHGSAVEIRTVMYPMRKHVKIKVSLTRKTHIIALPQGT
jgi:hypothetical protein